MTVTALTAHYDRPAAWDLCQKYLARQSRPVDQWLVIDSSPTPSKTDLSCDYHHRPDLPDMPAKGLFAIENNLIHGEIVIFWENDDWYRFDYAEWVESQMSKGWDILGEGNSHYFQVRYRWLSDCRNCRHAALCQTAIHRDMLENVANVIRSYQSPWFDTRLWSLDGNKNLVLPKHHSERRVIGIKGICATNGSRGYSGEHSQRMPEGAVADPALAKLWEWIGNDAEAYLPFAEGRAT